VNNESHYDACGNRQQELLHRQHLLVMDSEDRPTDFLRQSSDIFKGERTMNKSELAKAIVVYSFRNTSLEDIHAGLSPVSNTGDFSDVFVIDANGNKIPWPLVSRISQEEMKLLMQTAVNRVYAVLRKEDVGDLEGWALAYARSMAGKWDEPEEPDAEWLCAKSCAKLVKNSGKFGDR